MIPVNGKPVIGWILDDLLEKGLKSVIVVLRQQDHRLQSFLQRAYTGRMEVVLAPLRHEGTIIQSLQTGLNGCQGEGLVRVILGDTLIKDRFDRGGDLVYVGNVDDSRRWCLAVTAAGGTVIDYIDKQETAIEPKLALAGYYQFQNAHHLRECAERCVMAGDRELSDLLSRYGALYPIQAQPVEEWYDFGHIDNLVDARRRLIQPRYFNSLSINPILNTITKVSENAEKLRDELDWYLNIPDELKVLSPRILRHDARNGHLEVVQEYYGYPTLAELYVYGDLDPDSWSSILRHVLRIHNEFCGYTGKLERRVVESMYFEKTWDRLGQVRAMDPAWREMLEYEEVAYNGRALKNVFALEEAIREKSRTTARTAPVRIIHGDLCFSNILFDVNNQIIRLIDPRGSFGKKGIWGDARYDIAKLRHSVCGLYDYIVADTFELQQSGPEFSGRVCANGTPKVVALCFDRLVSALGYDLNDIRFIEGLLFISMLPLHQGHAERQRMMFLTGLSLLNDCLDAHSN
jgi:dTDP-glucose pyrophosphorylase